MDDLRSLLTEEIARLSQDYPDNYITHDLTGAAWHRLAESEIEVFGIDAELLPALHGVHWCWQALIDAQEGTHWQREHGAVLARARSTYAHIVAMGETIEGFMEFAQYMAEIPRRQAYVFYRRLEIWEIRQGDWRFEA